MKAKKVSFAIIAMAIVAIAVAVVSCKKDNENAMNNKTKSARTFDPRQIERHPISSEPGGGNFK